MLLFPLSEANKSFSCIKKRDIKALKPLIHSLRVCVGTGRADNKNNIYLDVVWESVYSGEV